MRTSIFAVLLVALALPAAAQAPAPAPPRYADVRLAVPDGDVRALLDRLARAGVHLDHAAPEKVGGALAVRTVLSAPELAAAQAAGVTVDVVTADLAAAVRQRGGGCPETTYPVTGSMGCYNTFDEIVATLDAIRAAHPSLVAERVSLGQSREGRDIWMVEISDNPGLDEGEPEVLYTANHHAREVQSPIVLLYWMWDLLDRVERGDPAAEGLVEGRRLFVVPVLNPDGYVYNETTDPQGGGFWRKNRRVNGGGSFGVDLNRNYDYLWGLDDFGSSPTPSSETYRGPSPFSEPELQALRDFLEGGRSVRVALNYHTYSDLLLYPWSYDEVYTPDHERFVAMAAAMTAENGYAPGTPPDILYPVNGGSDDWMYGEQITKPKILSFTPEVGNVSDGFWPDPSRIEALAAENVRMNDLAALYAGAAPTIVGAAYSDGAGGNGFIDPGEGIAMSATLRNDGLETSVGPHFISLRPVGEYSLACTNMSDVVDVTLAPGESIDVLIGGCGIVDETPIGSVIEMSLVVSNDQDRFPIYVPVPDLIVGTPEVFYQDDATTLDAWTVTGPWGLVGDAVSAPTAFSATPGGDSPPNITAVLTTAQPVDLSGADEAFLAFETKWDIEATWDWGAVEVSVGGGAWTPLAGAYTGPGSGSGEQPAGAPGYDGRQTDWVTERMDLTPYAGRDDVRLRFHFATDGGVSGFGWLVDDVRVFRLIDGGAVSADGGAVADAVELGPPRPNPTTGAVRLSARVPAGPATAAVYDALGRRVATLFAGDAAGALDLAWDGSASGAPAASGVYVVRLDAGGEVRTQRVLLTR